jgi:hypothetical protein
VQPEGGVVLAFDVNAVPAGASIAAAFPAGDGWHVEVVRSRYDESVLWIVKEIKELILKHRPLAVVSAGGGPARAIMPEVKALCEQRLITFRQLTVQDMGAAAGLFYDALRTRALSHGESESLDEAVQGARAKEVGDLWRFDRKGMRADASPIVAASLALFGAQEASVSRVDAGVWFPGSG